MFRGKIGLSTQQSSRFRSFKTFKRGSTSLRKANLPSLSISTR